MVLKSPRLLLAALAVALAGAVALGTSIIAQEGGTSRAASADITSAEAVLGAPLPQVQSGIAGLRRSGIGIDPARPDVNSRRVHVSYALDGHNVALLSVGRGSVAADGDPLQLPTGVAAVQTKGLADGTADVRYAWTHNGLALVLHVNVSARLSRSDADLIARSVR